MGRQAKNPMTSGKKDKKDMRKCVQEQQIEYWLWQKMI